MRRRLWAVLSIILLVYSGCGNGDQSFGGGPVVVPTASLDLRYDFPEARLPAGIGRMQILLYSQAGDLVRDQSLARTRSVTLDGLAVGTYLLRTLFTDEQGNPLGFSDRTVLVTSPGPNVVDIEVLLTGAPPDSTLPAAGTGPAQLAFLVHPSEAASGTSQDVQVVALDARGETAAFDGTVTLTLSEGSGVLSGTTNAQAVNGVADFSVLVVGQGLHRLQATAVDLASAQSVPFLVSDQAPVATNLRFVTAPTVAVVGQALGSIQVEVLDQFGNRLGDASNEISLGGLPLTGNATQNAVNGLASFPGLQATQAGSFQLTATSAGLTQASTDLKVDPSPVATSLRFVTVPANAQDVHPFTVTVEILDQFGARLDSNAPVTLALNSSTFPGLRLTGTLTQNALGGLATFPDVSLDDGAATATLSATSPGLAAAISSAIVVRLNEGRLYVSESPDLVSRPTAVPRMTSFVMGRGAGPLLDGAATFATRAGPLVGPVSLILDPITDTLWVADAGFGMMLAIFNASINSGISRSFNTNGFARGVAYDSLNDRLFVCEQSLGQCEIYDNATDPGRTVRATITYPLPTPREARSCVYDPAADRLFLIAGSSGLLPGKVDVFDNVSTLSGVVDGNTAPSRSVTDGLAEPQDLFYEPHTRRLYVRSTDPNSLPVGFEPQVLIYDAADTTPNPTQAAILHGFDPRINLQGGSLGVVVDWERDELYLCSGFDLATGEVRIFPGASQMTGNVSADPVRTVTGLDTPAGLSLDLTRD